MSLAESVLEIVEEMEKVEMQWGPGNSILKDYAKQLRRVVKAAESAFPTRSLGPRVSEQDLLERTELKFRLKQQAQQEEAEMATSLRLCVGGTLDGTCVPSGGAELGKPVKAPTGEFYVLKEDGRFHLHKEGS